MNDFQFDAGGSVWWSAFLQQKHFSTLQGSTQQHLQGWINIQSAYLTLYSVLYIHICPIGHKRVLKVLDQHWGIFAVYA